MLFFAFLANNILYITMVLGQHGGAVANSVAPQQDSLRFNPNPGPSLLNLHVLPEPVWAPIGYSRFLPMTRWIVWIVHWCQWECECFFVFYLSLSAQWGLVRGALRFCPTIAGICLCDRECTMGGDGKQMDRQWLFIIFSSFLKMWWGEATVM